MKQANVTFRGYNDFKNKLKEEVDKILKVETSAELTTQAESLIDEYINTVGQPPPTFELNRIANHLDNLYKGEYGEGVETTLSVSQEKRRKKREAPLAVVNNYDLKHENHEKPIRKYKRK